MSLFGRTKDPDLRIFFATDLHGSEICFRKALKAPEFYGASLLIIGGDLSGKALIPTVPTSNGRTAEFLGERHDLATKEDEQAFARHVADAGFYAWPVDDPQRLESAEEWTSAHRAAVRDRLAEWVELADDRLSSAGLHCHMAPGNDDQEVVDEVLGAGRWIVNGEGRLLELREGLTLASCGYSNPTPWNTHREESEEELEARMARIVPPETDCSGLLLNFHVPPHGTNLDVCPALDDDLRVITKGGVPQMTSAGSTSTRKLIETRQPLLSLHGHIHESKGAEKLGRTQCLNPGSTYGDGMLAGCLVDLDRKAGKWSVRRHMFTNG